MTAKVDLSSIRHIAKLSNLRLSAMEESSFESQLRRILSYVDEISAAEESVSASTTSQNGDDQRFTIYERPDLESKCLTVEAALSQAPKKIGTAFQVPRIIDLDAQ